MKKLKISKKWVKNKKLKNLQLMMGDFSITCTYKDCGETFTNKNDAIAYKQFKVHGLGHQADLAELNQQQQPYGSLVCQSLGLQKVCRFNTGTDLYMR